MNEIQTLETDDRPLHRNDTVRRDLRAATASRHADLHRDPLFARLADGTLDLHGYGAILRAQIRFHIRMAPAAGRCAAALGLPDIAARSTRRMRRLQRDMAALGIAPPVAVGFTPVSDSFAVGCTYALLGSAQGPPTVHRQLDALLPSLTGRSFFRGEADDGAAWRAFCSRLESYGRRPDRLPTLRAGAQHGFAVFRNCLEAGSGR